MKKQLLVLVFSSLAVAGFAQKKQITETSNQKISFGLQGGVTNYSMKGDAVKSLNGLLDYTNGMVTAKSRTGFYAGAIASIPMGGNISIVPGVFYSQKGYELNGELNIKGAEFLGLNAKAQLQSQYIDIPVLIKAEFGGLNVFAGPQVSYLAKADLRTTAGVLGINLLNNKLDATSQFNRWDAGITGGIGYSFNKFNLSASYDYGLSRVDKNKSANAYNRGFKVGIGINF